MNEIHYRTATVAGRELFYREAGDADAPVVLLLHGFPSSSFMFRNLIPLLAGDYRVIAPDHLGFGRSDAPGTEDFDYTFEALTDLTDGLLDTLDISRYAIYVQDYGAPIGWRLAIRHPESVTAIISQNGNAYDAGFVDSFWDTVRAYQNVQNDDTEAAARGALELETIKWQYVNGVPDASLVDPETWHHDHALVSRPGNDLVQLKLFRDYATNVTMYPQVHEYFRTSQVPLLAVWGRGDEIFGPAGALAFADDLPTAEIHLLPGGHFLLESALTQTAALITEFLARRLPK